ncbi:MAG: hypothetical protein QOG87_3087 [Actinomycetota bacterium]|jgi:diguanylate cyclase (GGDEF)-like protein/PAS domain S-box-containing protein
MPTSARFLPSLPATPSTRAAVGALGATTFFLGWIAFGVGGDRATLVFDDVGLVIAPTIAALGCVWAARRGAGRAWAWLAAFNATWAAGQVVWTYYEVVLHRAAPFPSLADVGFLGCLPFGLMGLLAFPAVGDLTASRFRVAVDGLIIAGSLVGAGWTAVLAPITLRASGDLATFLGVAYPAADIVLVIAALTVAVRTPPGHRRAMAYVIGGIVAVAIADSAFGALAATGRYSTGQLFDAGWAFGFLLIGVGAVAAVERSSGRHPADNGPVAPWLKVAPYMPVLLLLAATTAEQAVSGRVPTAVMFIVAAIGVLVVARQLLVFIENGRLSDRLQSELERSRLTEAALASAQRLARLGSWELVGDQLQWSDEHYRILGYEPGEVTAGLPTILAHLHPGDAGAFASAISRSRHTNEPFILECRIRTVAGEERWITFSTNRVFDGDEGVARLHGTIQDVTERHEAERAVRETVAELAEAQRRAHLGSWEWEVATRCLTWSDELYRIAGRTRDDFEPDYNSFLSIVHPDDRAMAVSVLGDPAWAEDEPEITIRLVRPSGEVRWMLSRSSAVKDPDGRVRKFVGTCLDVTRTKEAEAGMLIAERRFQQGFDHSPLGMAILDLEGRIIRANRSFCVMVGRATDAVVGAGVVGLLHPQDLAPLRRARRDLLHGAAETMQVEARYVRPDGSFVWGDTISSVVRGPESEPAYFFAQIQDVTMRRAAEAEVARAARHDPLTGLLNRSGLNEAIEAAHGSVALIVLDLNAFVEINEGLGHGIGDRVLVEVAARMTAESRSSDVVARVGGDEFAVLLPGVADPAVAQRVGSSLLVSLERAFVVEDVPLHVGATFGVAASAGNGDAKTLMRRAEMAMYRAKAAGAPSAVFDTSDELGGPARLALAAQLRNAIGNDELHLHYQPKIEVETGRVTGVEALARWDHPDRGAISPGEFIPLAEQAGLILPITKRLLDEALNQCARWRAEGIELEVAVNLSPRVLNDPDLVEWTAASLTNHGVPGTSLIYEITENALAEGPRVLRAIADLRALGIRLAIDDLGTGYSSLMYLKSLPVDELKIDRAFIAELAIDRRDQAIVRSIVELGRSLGLVVVAEGVEDAATLAVLRRLGCEVAQGYHCCRPASAADLTAWLAERSVGSQPSGSSP